MDFPVARVTGFGLGVAALALMAGCGGNPFDIDLRGHTGQFSTAEAAQSIASRPAADSRGVISYPNYQVAVAQQNDTVTAIAGRVGIPAEELARYNGIDANVKLRGGEIIALPRRVAESSGQSGGTDIASLAGSAIDSAAPRSSVITSPLDPAPSAAPAPAAAEGAEPARHKVARGETAYTIARLYGIPVKALAEWNGLGSDFAVREGQVLLIPEAGTAPQADSTPSSTRPGEGSPTPTPPSSSKPLPEDKPEPEAPAIKVPEPTLSTSSSSRMDYPVKGKIARAYSKGRNDGIDIAGASGDPVHAAADGTVAAITSSADQVPIIVVRHPDSLLTVYANVEQIKVQKGDSVKRGQQIAQLRGGDNSYVHFEVRNGFDSVDPMPYLE